MFVVAPVLAQDLECGMRQRDEAVFGTLAPMHMDHQALAVDIRDFQALRLLKPQTTGVDGAEEGIIMGGADTAEQTPDLLDAEHGRQAFFMLGPQDIERVPLALQDVQEKESDPAIADPHGVRGPVIDVLAAEEVVLQFLFGNAIGGLCVEPGEHAYGPGVGFLGALAFAIELQGLERLLVPVCHHDGLLSG